MCPCGGHARPGFVTLARLDSSTVLSVTGQSPWNPSRGQCVDLLLPRSGDIVIDL
jgi:hypothetical protein